MKYCLPRAIIFFTLKISTREISSGTISKVEAEKFWLQCISLSLTVKNIL